MELISVIVPVYNVEKFLEKCINSIINQTYKNLEIILVNDGSSDASPIICDEYAAKDSRIKVIHQPNGGLSAARNAGIDASSGEFILFVDSDDYIDTKMIEFLYSKAKKYNSDMTLCGFKYTDNSGNFWDAENITCPSGVISKDSFWNYFFKDNRSFYVTMWAYLFRRHLWDTLRFPCGKLHEDEFVIHSLVENSCTIAVFHEPFYYYTQRENSIVNSIFHAGNLDASEGIMDRCEFFIQKHDLLNAERSLSMAMYHITCGFEKLSPLNPSDKKRIKELKKKFKKLYFKLRACNIPMKTKIKYTVFSVSIKLFSYLKGNE